MLFDQESYSSCKKCSVSNSILLCSCLVYLALCNENSFSVSCLIVVFFQIHLGSVRIPTTAVSTSLCSLPDLCPLPVAKKDLVFDSEHPDSLIKLQYLDDTSRCHKREAIEEVSVKIQPKFLTQMKNQLQKEGGHAHFEAKLEPVTDPNLRVEWFRNGVPVQMGSRFRLVHDFGYVALDISKLIEEDSGTYTCIATNAMGRDELKADLKVLSE